MSVAFRRDSDEEHLEPKFELPIPAGPNLVTARGLAQIQTKVIDLEALLPRLTDEAEIAATKREMRYWRARQATAQLVPAPDGEAVAFGCTVTVRLNGKERSIALVGDDEADPATGMISFSAPLSRAMMNAVPGDLLSFGGRADALEVIAIEASAI